MITLPSRPMFALWVAFTALFPLVSTPVRAQSPAPAAVSAETYLQYPVLHRPQLSPDGTMIAVMVLEEERRYGLNIGRPDAASPMQHVAIPDGSVADFTWKGNDLIVLWLAGVNGPSEQATFDVPTHTLKRLRTDSSPTRLLSALPDVTDTVLMTARTTPLRLEDGPNGPALIFGRDLVRLNVRTGKEKVVERDPGTTLQWFVNRAGDAVAAWGTDGKNAILWWRDKPGAKWKQTKQLAKDGPVKLEPLGVAPDQRRLVVIDTRRHPAGEVVYYDPATGGAEAIPGAGAPGGNPQWETWGSRGEAGAVVSTSDGEVRRRFLNPQTENLRKSLGAAFPGAEITFESFSDDDSRIVLQVESDRSSGDYFLLERGRPTLMRLGTRFPLVTAERLSPGRPFGFKTAAGLDVSGRIILPPGRDHPPLIVYQPSTPSAEMDASVFGNELQYFASLGYAVAVIGRPNKGTADPTAAMPTGESDDLPERIRESIRWLAAQGWIDGRKVAVMGRFFGGIPTLVALTPPDLVQALVNLESPMVGAPTAPIGGMTSGRGTALVGGPIVQPSSGQLMANARSRTGVDKDLPAALPAVPSLHFYSVVDRPASSGPMLPAGLLTGSTSGGVVSTPRIVASATIFPQYESAAHLVAALQKKKQVAELVSSAELVRELGLPWNSGFNTTQVRARRDERIVAFLKKNGLE